MKISARELKEAIPEIGGLPVKESGNVNVQIFTAFLFKTTDSLAMAAKKEGSGGWGRVTDYFRTGAAGVFITTPPFGWSFRYSTLCDPCFNDFMPFEGEETAFAATVPDPDLFGAFSCVFVPAIFVSWVGVVVKIVQTPFIIFLS